MSDPVTHSFVHCVLKRCGAAGHFVDAGSEQLHAKDIERLTPDVLGAHENIAFQAEECGDRGSSNPMLAGAGFRNHLAFSHTAGQEDLAHGIINLMSSGMVQVFTLQIDLRATEMFGEPFSKIKWTRATDIIFKVRIKLCLK